MPSTNSKTGSFARRRRRALTITSVTLAGLIAASVGSYAVIRATHADFPLVYSEKIKPGITEGIDLADPSTALSFARVDTESGPTVLAVTEYDNGTITGIDLSVTSGTPFTEPIAAFNQLGYAAVETIALDTTLPTISVDASEVLTSLDTHTHHVGIGTNYPEHQEEATIEEPFLFPKIGAVSDSNEPLLAGTKGLLDYEVELGMVALNDITIDSGVPEHMGLVLSNDWSDRELLLSQIDVDNLASGSGFTNAKSQPGFLSTGDLFVIPADWQSYYQGLQLDLFVNGELRQRTDPSEMIWDGPALIQKTLAVGDTTWDSDGEPTTLTANPGVISTGTILQSGTSEGVIHRAPDTRQRILGFMEYAASIGTNAESIAKSAIKVYIRDAHDADVYLKPDDEIVTRAEGLGQIFTTIIPGERSDRE